MLLQLRFNFLPYGGLRTTLMLITLSYAGTCMLLNLLALFGLTLRRFWGFTAGFMAYALMIPAPALLIWLWGAWGLLILLSITIAGLGLWQNRRWFDEVL